MFSNASVTNATANLFSGLSGAQRYGYASVRSNGASQRAAGAKRDKRTARRALLRRLAVTLPTSKTGAPKDSGLHFRGWSALSRPMEDPRASLLLLLPSDLRRRHLGESDTATPAIKTLAQTTEHLRARGQSLKPPRTICLLHKHPSARYTGITIDIQSVASSRSIAVNEFTFCFS
jgi:hypothetical protein